MKNAKMNLCNTCSKNMPECEANNEDVEYGNGVGNDNIIKCDCYKLKSNLEKDCCPNCGCETFSKQDLGKYICCKCFEIY